MTKTVYRDPTAVIDAAEYATDGNFVAASNGLCLPAYRDLHELDHRAS